MTVTIDARRVRALLPYLTAEERRQVEALSLVPPSDWQPWLEELFPAYVRGGFAPRHRAFWDWVWAIEPDDDPDPFVGIWPRGGGKTTSVELAVAMLGVRGRRKYVLYVRSQQDRADDSVSNIAALLESAAIARHYPDHGRRRIGKYGNSQGWRRNRLRTDGGFTVDAFGLDVAARGAKLEEQRPDLIIFDDVDDRHDSGDATEKKLTTIRESLLPAGTANCAVIAIQNLIIPHGIFARLADGRADFLARRIVSGPEPALRGFETERYFNEEKGRVMARIVAGEPTWEGQDRVACQQLMDRIGFTAFDRECQHNVEEREGALWTRKLLEACRRAAPAGGYKRVVVGVDPSGGSEEIGIIGGGLGYDNHAYIFADRTAKGARGPLYWGQQTAALYHDSRGDKVVAERNFGGDMVESNIKVADKTVPVKLVHASRGKAVRAEPVASLYEDGLVHHVGTLPELETEMMSWVPGDPDSPNRMDAAVWVLTELLLSDRGPRTFVPASTSYVSVR